MQPHTNLAAAALVAASLLVAKPALAQDPSLRVSVRNDLDVARPGAVVEVPASLFAGVLGEQVLHRVRVFEEPSGREILAQAIDLDGDLAAEQIVFQADLGAKQAKTFRLELGEERSYRPEDFHVYGRFVRERFDDFAWENDEVAFRVYGKALETWQREPLTSSAVDAWVKSTSRLALNDWYMVDDYHHDHGEGGDFYPAGASRGCGGSGLWEDGALVVSKNFRASRVLAAGPIRLVFELDYPVWPQDGVRETKRVTLDAGSRFNRFESRYELPGGQAVSWVAGTKVEKGAETRRDLARGLVSSWEHLDHYGDNGWLGCGVVLEPGKASQIVEADGNLLLVGHMRAGQPARYHAGTAWDRSGAVSDVDDWNELLDDFVAQLGSPLHVEVAKQ